MKLGLWEEVTGMLKSIKEESDGTILTFENIGFFSIDSCNKSFMDKLIKRIGQQVALLRTDIPGREYLLR